MDIRAEEISKIIRDQIGSFAVEVDVAEVGSVISVGDGIARVHGVERAMSGEMLEFTHGVLARFCSASPGRSRKATSSSGRAASSPCRWVKSSSAAW